MEQRMRKEESMTSVWRSFTVNDGQWIPVPVIVCNGIFFWARTGGARGQAACDMRASSVYIVADECSIVKGLCAIRGGWGAGPDPKPRFRTLQTE